MTGQSSIQIGLLIPEVLGTYSDAGNATVLAQRACWRGIPAEIIVINAREADGRDTSWLWDVPFEGFPPRPMVASGERAADLGVRLSYAGLEHSTEPDPVAALSLLLAGTTW